MDNRVIEIRKRLKKKLDPLRFEHTLGVSYTCQALAMRYGYDLDKAELAGLLHDCAKRYDNTTMLEKCKRKGIDITDSEYTDPSLLHAKLGAWMAKEKYGIEDEEIADAIRCHTTGRTGMTLLDKILYVADYIEPRRDKAEDLPEMRRLSFIDLDQACLSIMDSVLNYLKSKNCPIDPLTQAARDDMKTVVERNRQKEDVKDEPVKRYGTARSRSFGGEKRRRHKSH